MNQFSNVAPALAALGEFDVNVENVSQVIWQPLYDYQAYAAAGTSSMTFYQVPKGQNGKTFEQTNMTNAGILPAPKEFLCVGMEFFVKSGADTGATGAAATLNQSQIADINALQGRGHVQIFVGSKPVLDEIGIDQFPCGTFLHADGAVADSTSPAADKLSHLAAAGFRGRPYMIEPFRIPANQNFEVSLEFPSGVVAMPSGEDATIGCRLLGWQYRLAQ